MTLPIEKTIATLATHLTHRKLKLATAESCTGGGLSYWLTNIAGSSNWFERGFVTYSNEAKSEMLGVKAETLKIHGAVSEETAREMAEGALTHSKANISLAITGIAGPEGGSVKKPIGTVWFALASDALATHACVEIFTGDRQAIRMQAIEKAVGWLLQVVKK